MYCGCSAPEEGIKNPPGVPGRCSKISIFTATVPKLFQNGVWLFFILYQKVMKTKKNHGKSRGFYGISHVILPTELLREKNATQNCRALHSLFHQGRFGSCLHNNTTAIGYKNWLRRQALNLRCPGYESLFFDNAR